MGGLGGSIAGPPASTMLAGQSGLLGFDLRQGVGDWVEDRGPVKPQPVASHRPGLAKGSDQGGLGGRDAGGHAGGDGGVARQRRRRAPEALLNGEDHPEWLQLGGLWPLAGYPTSARQEAGLM